MPPTNLTPATATVIAAPFAGTLDVTDAPSSVTNIPPRMSGDGATTVYHAVWYQWTCPDNVDLLHLTGYHAPGSDVSYLPMVSVWTGTAASLTILVSSEGVEYTERLDDSGGPTYFRLPTTAGTTYWFQCCCYDPATGFAQLALEAFYLDPVTAPAGSFVVSDDADGFPASVFSPSGTFLQFRAFPAGEHTATMPDGSLCTQDGTANVGVVILDQDWNRVASHSFAAPERVYGIWSDQHAYFYVQTRPATIPTPYLTKLYKLSRLDASVVHVTVVGTVSSAGFKVGAPSQDGTTFVGGTYGGSGSTVDKFIERWDIVNDVLLDSWAAGDSTYAGWGVWGNGFSLADGTVFLARGAGGTQADLVLRVNGTTGAVIQTYDVTRGSIVRQDRICYISETQFGIYGWNADTTFGYFQVIDIATGAIVSESAAVPVTSGSVTSEHGHTAYAMSESCPVFVVPVPLIRLVPGEPVPGPGPGPDGGGGGIVPSPPNGTDAAGGCVAAPVRAECWNPHDINALQVRLHGEGQP